MNFSFKVIDTTTEREVSADKIEQIAKDYSLLEMDIDGFCINEDGYLLLVDDCGKSAYVDVEKYGLTPVFDDQNVNVMRFDFVKNTREEAVMCGLSKIKIELEHCKTCKQAVEIVDHFMTHGILNNINEEEFLS